MTFPRARPRFALLLLGVLVGSCSDSARTNDADATLPADLGAVNDLAPDLSATIADAPPEERLDASADAPVDGGLDVPADGGADVTADRPDARGPVGDAWAGVPLVDLGGFLIPVDPHAVPAPGSECVGDAGVRVGDPAIAPPRPVRPLSVSRVTSQRPTFQWVLPEGTTGARVEVCADRCCTRVIQTFEAEGTTVRPMTALPPGVVFWRMFGRRGTAVGARASYTWEFEVRRRDAPNDTSWGTIRDFNGDGFDDLVMFHTTSGDQADLLLLRGSAEGLRPPVLTGVVARHLPSRAMLGDFNGDGLADIAWDDRTGSWYAPQSWFEIVEGSRGPLHSSVQPDIGGLGSCARTGDGSVVDWNGDGYSDLIIGVGFGCGFSRPPEASVLLGYSGSPAGVAPVPQWALRLDGRFSHSLVTVTEGIGDLDNDGYGEIFVRSSFSGAGTSSVPPEHAILHGTAVGEPRIEHLMRPGPSARGWNNARPAPIGDVDGDGYLDFLVSLNYSSPIYVYRHATGRVTPSSVLTDPIGGENFGFYFSSGDVNGDGLSDVIVSSELAHTTMNDDGFPINMGRVYVFPGSVGGVAEPVWLERAHPHMKEVIREIFGSESMSPGDVNGDGIDDVVMGDTVEARLCVRYGRIGFANGSPDICLDGVRNLPTWSY